MRNTGASSAGAAGLRPRRPRAHDEIRQRDRGRPGQPAGGFDGAVERLGRRRLERLDLVVGDAGFPQQGLVHEQRVTGPPLLHLVRGSVALGIALVVAVPAIGRRLDEGGAAPVARGSDDVLHD